MNITLHLLNALPYNAMNRDETGAPKHYFQGGVPRGQLTSQSIKRAVRKDFETFELAVDEKAYRTGTLPQWTFDRVRELAPEVFPNDETGHLELLNDIDKALGALNRKNGKADSTENDDEQDKDKKKIPKLSQQISLFISLAEAEMLALRYADSLRLEPWKGSASKPRVDVAKEVLDGARTGSLSIACNGRMFANANGNSVHAALAVSNASCVHETNIEVDYFTTVADQLPGAEKVQGATFLAEQAYTTGVFYRTLTLDCQQLLESWSGWDRDDARDQVSAMVESMIRALPTGKKNSTGAFTPPVVVMAERQNYRQNYHFETPVQPGEAGGYDRPAALALAKQAHQLRRFAPSMITDTVYGGTADQDVLDQFPGTEMNLDQLRDQVVDWVFDEVAKTA